MDSGFVILTQSRRPEEGAASYCLGVEEFPRHGGSQQGQVSGKTEVGLMRLSNAAALQEYCHTICHGVASCWRHILCSGLDNNRSNDSHCTLDHLLSTGIPEICTSFSRCVLQIISSCAPVMGGLCGSEYSCKFRGQSEKPWRRGRDTHQRRQYGHTSLDMA